MNEFMEQNRTLWNAWTDIHEKSTFYNVEGFKAGAIRLHTLEREEVGDVTGKSLLHLQCHFGLDTLSWARLGARVTGVDFSERAIALAKRLSAETGIEATFVESNLYEAPNVLQGAFDIVYTSYGVLTWLPDMKRWAEVVAHFLRPGGLFYIAEFHPFAYVFDDETEELKCRYPYCRTSSLPGVFQSQGTYADPTAKVSLPEYYWDHSLGEIVTALIEAGLQIQYLHEFPFCGFQMLPCMEKSADGYWRLKENNGMIPLLFSLKATKKE